jgi:hypothetical protein
MRDQYKLAGDLMEVVKPRISAGDRAVINIALRAGEPYFAIDDILRIAAREGIEIPAGLIAEVRTWLDGYAADKDQPRFRKLIAFIAQQYPSG